MRYIVYGAGAVGSLLGGYLSRAGKSVVLLGRQAHVARMQTAGLTIKNKFGTDTIAIEAVQTLGSVKSDADDVIFLCVKSQATEGALAELQGHFSTRVPLFCWQNGIRNEPLAARAFVNTYGGLVFLGARYVEPGHIIHTAGRALVVGRYPHGADDRAKAVAQDLEAAGFKVSVFESIVAVKWSKLVLNTSNALYALIGLPMVEACNVPEVQHFVADLWDEGLDVLERAGVDYRPLPGHPTLREITAKLRRTAPPQPAPDDPELGFYPSTWQDLDLGRGETELRYLNGEIIALGRQHHILTPLNDLLERLVEDMAAKNERPGKYNIDELYAMRA